jgi:hypothetical protein
MMMKMLRGRKNMMSGEEGVEGVGRERGCPTMLCHC